MEPQADATRTLDDLSDLVLTFIRLSEKARRHGLLSLEEETSNLPDDTLREGLVEVVDGTPPQLISQILDARIDEVSRRLEEERQDRISRLRLIKTGVLLIQEGAAPRLVAALLGAQITPDRRERIAAGLSQARQEVEPHGPDTAPGITEVDVEHFTMDTLIKLRRNDVRRLVRDLDTRLLLVALRGTGPEVQQKIMEGMSRRTAAQLAEDIKNMWPVPLSQIEQARSAIAATLQRLVREHEIYAAAGDGDQDALQHATQGA